MSPQAAAVPSPNKGGGVKGAAAAVPRRASIAPVAVPDAANSADIPVTKSDEDDIYLYTDTGKDNG